MTNLVERVARELSGYFGPVFDALPRDEIQRREWNRNHGHPYEESQADILDASKAAIAIVLEEAAKVAEENAWTGRWSGKR